MSKDETLVRVPNGRHQSYSTVAENCAKELAVRYGRSDVADFIPAYTLTKERRPVISSEIAATSPPLFCDNMVCIGKGSSQGTVLDFFKSFHLTNQGNPNPSQKISIKPMKREAQAGSYRWKVAMADVPLDTVQFVQEVYVYAGQLTWCVARNSHSAKLT